MTEIKLQKWGNSQGIRISKEILEGIGFGDSSNIIFDMEIQEGKILLIPKIELTPYERLFVNYDLSKPKADFSWNDDAVGKEFW